MSKQKFLLELEDKLKGLPKKEIEESVNFYSEMIDDHMEEGLTEEKAVKELGSIDEIVNQIVSNVSLLKITKEKIHVNGLRVWEIVLLVLGSPIWLSILITILACILVVYVCLWSCIAVLWSVFIALVASILVGIMGGIIFLISGGNLALGGILFGSGIAAVGLSVFMFYASLYSTKGMGISTKKIFIWIKKCIMKRRKA